MYRIATVLLITCALLPAASAHAVAPDVDWEHVYGDTLLDIASWVEEHSSYGYVVAGRGDFDVDGDQQAILMRLDPDGDTLWTRTYGDSLDDAAMCVRETPDGGFILAGYKERVPSNADAWFVRTNSGGDTLWTSNFDFGEDEFLYCVEEMDDGGFMGVGFTSSYSGSIFTDVLILKVDSLGGGEWKAVYGGPGHNRGYGMCRTSDGDCLVAGYTEVGADRGDWLLIKIDASNGDSLWSRTYGDTTMDMCRRVKETSDGGLILCGTRTDYDYGYSVGRLIRTDALGYAVWTTDYGETSTYTSFSSVDLTPDMGYICAGYRDTSITGDSDVLFVKTDSGGDTLWTKTVGGTERETALEVKLTDDLGYVAAGYGRPVPGTDFDIYIVKLGTDEARIGTAEPVHQDALLAVEGASPFRHSVSVRYVIEATTHVDLVVYDVTGRHVVTLVDDVRGPGSHGVTWDFRNGGGRSVPSGVYFIRCTAAGRSGTEKVLILR